MDADEQFEIAREIAEAIADATQGIPTEIRMLGLAVFVAAEAAAGAEDELGAYRRVEAFTETVLAQVREMLARE